MVVMVMADDHDVDLGQIVKGNAGFRNALWPHTKGACAFAKDRIGQDVDAARLHKHGRMADPRREHARRVDLVHAPLPVFGNARIGYGTWRRFGRAIALRHSDTVGPFGATVGPKQIADDETSASTAARWCKRILDIGIEKALAVKMCARRPFIINPVKERRHDHDQAAQSYGQEQHPDHDPAHDPHHISIHPDRERLRRQIAKFSANVRGDADAHRNRCGARL